MVQPLLNQPKEAKSNTRLLILLGLLVVILVGGGILAYRYISTPESSNSTATIKPLDTAPLNDDRLVTISKNFGDAPTVSDAERGRTNPFAPIQK